MRGTIVSIPMGDRLDDVVTFDCEKSELLKEALRTLRDFGVIERMKIDLGERKVVLGFDDNVGVRLDL